jgi:hypothetical protein
VAVELPDDSERNSFGALTADFVQAGNGSLPGLPKGQNGLVPTDYHNIAPRIGFSFQPPGNTKALVVLIGYSVGYNQAACAFRW